MDTDNPRQGDEDEAPDAEPVSPDAEPVWEVEGEKTMDKMLDQTPPSDPEYDGGGMMIFTDEHGRRRRIPAERGQLSGRELGAAANALHRDLGAPTADYARMAAIERLTELHASGKMSEENFLREKKRLENYGR